MIGIDITTTQNQYRHRGIGVFSKNIVQRFISEMESEIVLFGFSSESTISSFRDTEFIDMGKLKEITPLTKLSYAFALKSLVLGYNRSHKNKPITSFFSPFIHSGVPYDDSWNTTVYVHDVIQLQSGIYSTKSALHNQIKKNQYIKDWKSLIHARTVLTNSITSRDAIRTYIGIESIPIYLGIDHTLYNPYYEKNADYIKNKYQVSTPYLLYYGGDEANKNVPFLINAFSYFQKEHPEMHISLIIVGSGFENERKIVVKENLENIYFLGLVDDLEKINLMVNATSFIHLSKVEGFGISVLENLACAVPCIISDIEIYKELFSGCAIFADTSSIEKTSQAINCIMNEEIISQNIQNGIKRSLEFDWNTTYKNIRDNII